VRRTRAIKLVSLETTKDRNYYLTRSWIVAFQYPTSSAAAGVLALPADRRSRDPPCQARMAVLASSATPDMLHVKALVRISNLNANLMAFPGLVPTFTSLRSGGVGICRASQ
jgi:hypothetical protein